jgi:electron transport complex protein RnfB
LNTEHVSADVQAQIDAAEARRRRLGLADNDTANNADTAAADTPPNPAGTRNPR